jgi:hypothetical protein
MRIVYFITSQTSHLGPMAYAVLLSFQRNFPKMKQNAFIVRIKIELLEPFLGPDKIFNSFVSPAPYC